jgi:hypothetical protein
MVEQEEEDFVVDGKLLVSTMSASRAPAESASPASSKWRPLGEDRFARDLSTICVPAAFRTDSRTGRLSTAGLLDALVRMVGARASGTTFLAEAHSFAVA